MSTTTLYCRSDQHTINTVTTYKWDPLNSASSLTFEGLRLMGYPSGVTGLIYKVNSGGARTQIGSSLTMVSSGDASPQSKSWACPLTSLVATDALLLKVTIDGCDTPTVREFITEQLVWSQLNAVTWTVKSIFTVGHYGNFPSNFTGFLQWFHGDATYDTNASNVGYVAGGQVSGGPARVWIF